jgi:CheY-like chemotaxis protein
MYSSAEDSLFHPVVIKPDQRFWKRILIVDDNEDVTTTFKVAIEDSNNDVDVNKRIKVYTSNDPVLALSEFKPNFYDLLFLSFSMHNDFLSFCIKQLQKFSEPPKIRPLLYALLPHSPFRQLYDDDEIL